MPKIPIDYSKTVLYKLVCNDLSVTELYVGSTTQFTKRKYQHKHRCTVVNDNPKHNYFVYRFMRQYDGWENWNMVLIESYPCQNKLEKDKRERYWLETLQASLNKSIPSRTRQEWRDLHKNEHKQYNINYYQQNKEELLKKYSQKCICVCGKKHNFNNASNHRKTKYHINFINSTLCQNTEYIYTYEDGSECTEADHQLYTGSC